VFWTSNGRQDKGIREYEALLARTSEDEALLANAVASIDGKRRELMHAFVDADGDHADFIYWALTCYCERVRDRSDAPVTWPLDLHLATFDLCSAEQAEALRGHWIGLAEELLAAVR
jgi:hypothetical protein